MIDSQFATILSSHESIGNGLGITEPLVFVLVLNYQSLYDTIECIDYIRASDYTNIRFLVIDNASPDGSGAELSTQIDQDDFVQLTTNIGYAGGNNVGIKIAMDAGAEHIFILNPDVRVGASTISECVKAVESDSTIGAVSPIQIYDYNGLIDRKFSNAVLMPAGVDATVYQDGAFPKILEVSELLGAALFLPVRAIERVGGFDPLYFAYGEETDLCKRLRYHGFKLVVTGSAPVRHLRTKESTGVSDRILFLRLKGLYLGKLKDPWRSFRRSLRLVAVQFFEELLDRRRGEYPFNQYPMTRVHSIRAFLWVLVNLMRIRHHRRIEQLGRAHV